MKPLLTKIIALLAGAWRYRWQGLIATWIICMTGWLGVWSIPDKYAVQAKVYIDTDTVLGPLMRGLTVPTDQQQQVDIMLRQMTSRPNLEQIVRLVNPRAAKMTPAEMELAVTDIGRNIDMHAETVKNLFTIGYIDNNSAYAETVTQSLLSILVDSGTGDKRRGMDSARSFIDRKISEYEIKLREAETRRANFKSEHLDAITAGIGAEAVGAELQKAKNDLSSAQVTVTNLRSQLASIPQTVASDQLPSISDRGGSGGGSSNALVRLQQAEQQLIDLRSTYTESHPDVIALKQVIAQLQKEVNQPSGTKRDASVGVPNPVYVDVRTKLSAAEVQVALLQHQVAAANDRLSYSKKNAVEMIAINNKYADLDRDYTVLQTNYSELVKSRESARLQQSMTEQSQSMDFRIIEPPKRTEFPVSPPRLLLNSAVLLAGLAAGIALSIVLSIFGGRFTTSEELAEYFSLPLLGVVTIGQNAAATREARTAITVMVVGVISLCVIYGFVAALLTTSIYTKLGI